MRLGSMPTLRFEPLLTQRRTRISNASSTFAAMHQKDPWWQIAASSVAHSQPSRDRGSVGRSRSRVPKQGVPAAAGTCNARPNRAARCDQSDRTVSRHRRSPFCPCRRQHGASCHSARFEQRVESFLPLFFFLRRQQNRKDFFLLQRFHNTGRITGDVGRVGILPNLARNCCDSLLSMKFAPRRAALGCGAFTLMPT